MPSFDVVSEINMHELTNALDQASREVSTRFDFKGSNARYEHKDKTITLHAQSDFQLKQMLDILNLKLAKRSIDIACLEIKPPQQSGKEARQEIVLKQGIDSTLGKKITGLIKDSKIKVQASIMGEQVRVTGKKRDDLQEVIALLRQAKLDLPVQFSNFRD